MHRAHASTPKVAAALAVVFILALGSIQIYSCAAPEKQTNVESDTSYARVLRTGKIRAAYVSYPPSCIVDTETGELSGIFIDLLRQIAKKLELELEFTEEVGWATMIQGLDAHRYDIIGNAVWANPVRGKLATLSTPVYFSGIGVWVRADETRFSPENNWQSINQPSVKVAAMDGSTPEVIAHEQFPRAELITYPDLTGEPQIFLDLTSKKADVFFAEPAVAMDFLENNPGTIKNLAADAPLRLFANIFMMRRHESQMKQMIDVAIRDLLSSGVVGDLINKYESSPNVFYRVARPYRLPE